MEDRYTLNKELAQMLKGGVIMDVTTPEQARIAEEAGACAVMALERIPADIRASSVKEDPGNPGGCIHTGYGKMQDRAFCGGTDPGGHRD